MDPSVFFRFSFSYFIDVYISLEVTGPIPLSNNRQFHTANKTAFDEMLASSFYGELVDYMTPPVGFKQMKMKRI